MSEERRLFGDAWAFTQSAGKGAWNAGSGMVEGLKDLAKGGYKLATDEKARDAAWETTKQLAETTKKYAEAAYEDPEKAYRDARDGALTAYDKFEQARDLADAEGRSAEFWGEMAGGGAFDVATMLIPVGALAKVGTLGKVAKGAEVAKAIGKIENIEDILGASPKAKGVLGKPVILEADYKCSSIQRCPNEYNDDKPVIIKSLDELEEGYEGKNSAEVNSDTVFSGHGAHSNKLTTVPEGTSVTVYSGPGGSITDKLGNKIETGGDLSKVPKKTYHSGDQMPDNILYEPKGLDIKGNPVTVEKPTRLSELLKPDMGECHWAACTSSSGEKFSDTVFHTDGMYDQLGNKIKSYD